MKTPKSRKAMAEFLSGHFRYDTMNSWNRATSYARNVKLSRLTFPDNETRSRAYDLLQVDGLMDDVNFIMEQFAEDHGWEWQMGFNGRSGGYLVLYQGKREATEHKSRCTNCYQLNFKTVEETGNNACGKCGCDCRKNLTVPVYRTMTFPGKGVDGDFRTTEDFDEWSTEQLRDRVKLVMEFDQACDDCVSAFIEFCKTHKAEERTVQVPRQIMVATEL